jgi:alpha-tubulin suppressor-like RCC1 family protein
MAVAGGVASRGWFQWGPAGTLTQATAPVAVGSGSGVVLVSAGVSGLQPARQYESRLVVSNALGVVTGAVTRFTTGARVAVWGGNGFGQGSLPSDLGPVAGVAGGYNLSLAWNTEGRLSLWGSVPAGAGGIVGESAVVAAGGGQYHVALLRADGTVVAAGANYYGQTNVPAGLGAVVTLGVGYNHNVVVQANGQVRAWGRNQLGQTNVPAGLSNVVTVAAGVCGNHSLALRADGTVAAWGHNNFGQSSVPAGLGTVVAVAGGESHSLALRANGTVAAWGLNNYGQSSVPAGLGEVIAIAAGANHSLALKRDGSVVIWGLNTSGQTALPGGLANLALVAGGRDQSLAAGGVNNPPVAQAQQVVLPVGRPWVIGLEGSDPDGDALAFDIMALPGRGSLHQYDAAAGAGVGVMISAAGTRVSDAQGRVVFVPAAGAGVATPYTSFQFRAWDGQAGSPAQGVGLSLERFESFTRKPVAVSATGARLRGWAAPNGQAARAWFAWERTGGGGGQTEGQELTGGEGMLVPVAAQLSGLEPGTAYRYRLVVSNAAGVSVGRQQSLLTGGAPRPWGTGTYGQTNVPAGLTQAVRVWAGQTHALALDTEGRLHRWGADSSQVPAGLGGVEDLAVGLDHTLALDAAGQVWAWGGNQYRQLNVPAGLGPVAAVGAGEMFSVALRRDGTVAAWGLATQGQCSVPAGLNGVVEVACGAAFTLALRADGTVVAWGMNDYGQATVPAGLNAVVAVGAGAYHAVALRRDGTVVTWGGQRAGAGERARGAGRGAGTGRTRARELSERRPQARRLRRRLGTACHAGGAANECEHDDVHGVLLRACPPAPALPGARVHPGSRRHVGGAGRAGQPDGCGHWSAAAGHSLVSRRSRTGGRNAAHPAAFPGGHGNGGALLCGGGQCGGGWRRAPWPRSRWCAWWRRQGTRCMAGPAAC